MVTVHLVDGWTGEKLDVIRGLYIYYPPGAAPRPPAPRPARVLPPTGANHRNRVSRIPRQTCPGKRPPTTPVEEGETMSSRAWQAVLDHLDEAAELAKLDADVHRMLRSPAC